jgi:ABC-type uncharacterized transport system permease subunit
MMEKLLIIFTGLLYALVFAYEWCLSHRQVTGRRWLGFILAFVALLGHACLLHEWIDVGHVQNLSMFNMIALVAWVGAVLLWFLSAFERLDGLWLVVVPLIYLSFLLRGLFPEFYPTNMSNRPLELVHIVLAVLLVGTFCLAGLQALVLRMQQMVLKQKTECTWMARLPAIESMERLLQVVLWLAFVLLSLVLFTSLYFYHDRLADSLVLLRKSLVIFAAWLVFLATLLGRHFFSWRAQQMTRGVLLGLVVVLLIYLLA